jgi:hypothetical protein
MPSLLRRTTTAMVLSLLLLSDLLRSRPFDASALVLVGDAGSSGDPLSLYTVRVEFGMEPELLTGPLDPVPAPIANGFYIGAAVNPVDRVVYALHTQITSEDVEEGAGSGSSSSKLEQQSFANGFARARNQTSGSNAHTKLLSFSVVSVDTGKVVGTPVELSSKISPFDPANFLVQCVPMALLARRAHQPPVMRLTCTDSLVHQHSGYRYGSSSLADLLHAA